MPEVMWHLIENPDGTGFLKQANIETDFTIYQAPRSK